MRTDRHPRTSLKWFAWGIPALLAISCTKNATTETPTLQETPVQMSPEPIEQEPRAIVDQALRKHGDLGVYGDLSAGLEALEPVFTAQITPAAETIHVSLSPHSGEGHDFSFQVHRTTGEISEMAIGVLEPPPDF
jgi:hypothetical protein